MFNEYTNGYIEKKRKGFEGVLRIDGINLGEITGGFYSDRKNGNYVWLRRKPILEYHADTKSYTSRPAYPFFECYAFECKEVKNIAYRGRFFFLHFTYDIVCCWDDIIKDRLNIYIVRSKEQTLINAIKKNRQ